MVPANNSSVKGDLASFPGSSAPERDIEVESLIPKPSTSALERGEIVCESRYGVHII